jgi:hypothetical protein
VKPSFWRRHRADALIASAVVVVLGAAGGGAVAVARMDGGAPQPSVAAAPPTSQTAAAQPIADAPHSWCADLSDGFTLVTPDDGDADLAVIAQFEDAYYVGRSGEQARALGSVDAIMGTAQQIQEGIDTLPPGTDYCVVAAPAQPGEPTPVDVYERRPDGQSQTYKQKIAVSGGQITAFANRESNGA